MTCSVGLANIVALDLSLTSTGWACVEGVGTFTTKERGLQRLQRLREQILTLAGPTTDVAAIEGYAFGRPNGMAALGELGGVVRLALYEHDITIVDVPPASLKKYATGKGNANKELMLVEAVRRLGYAGSNNDEADALWLYTMTCDALCGTAPVVPQAHRVALNAIDWPTVGQAA